MTTNSDFKLKFNSLTNYVPQNLRNPVSTSLIENLFDRFLTHDESVPLYGYVGRKPASPDDRSPRVPQDSVERDINSIVPVMNFQLGAERFSFTLEDLIRKAEALGISPGSLQWLYSQGNNYLPPIDLDKFTNFFNYYWVAKSISAVPSLSWNPTLAPEYYTIAAPLNSDLNKLNVVAASTTNTVLTGSGFVKLSFKVTFTDETHFTISTVGNLGAYTPATSNFALSSNDDHFVYNVTGPSGIVTLVEFDITRDEIFDQFGNSIGLSGFEADDAFNIDTDFLTRNYTVTFAGATGVKGKLTKVKTLNEYQKIDNVQLRAGDRVLIKSNSTTDDGIYIVSPGVWSRAPDFDGPTRVAGATVFDKNRSIIYKSVEGGGGIGFQAEPATPGGTQSNTNQWQEGNYWVSGEKLSELGLARADAIQAVRPIIEYAGNLQLNSFVKNGRPSDSGTPYKQIKTEFNQLPLFDLFRYDGTHSGLVSSVFYYEEDLTADLDLKLQKRVMKSTNDSADFIFNHGMADEDGSLLFVKRAGELKTIWHAGYTEPTVVDKLYGGAGNGTIEGMKAKGFTQQQVWTLTAETQSTFSVQASKMPVIPSPFNIAVVGQKYDNGEIEFTIEAGSIDFVPGDTFVFRVANFESPRYVARDEDGNIFDRFGGPAFDPNGEGAWQIPRTFYNNPYNDSRSPVTEGVLYSHFRGILSNQLEGNEVDYSFGGSMKLWSEQQTLLASLLMQRDMTPITIIDLAQRQYDVALNTVRDIYLQNIEKFVAKNGEVTSMEQLEKLLSFIQNIRSHDNDVRTVLYDTTSPLVGFPATLPQLGMAELVEPHFEFDSEMGMTLLVHHDGHRSTMYQDNVLNSLMLLTERKLFEGINPNARKYDFTDVENDPEFKAQLKKELFSYAALNGVDPLASNYNAADPFTWNYSSQFYAARWSNVLKEHQATIQGVIPTERPNLEPWKLFGFMTYDLWQASLSDFEKNIYAGFEVDNSYQSAGVVKVVKLGTGITALTGAYPIEGVNLVPGDRVLLTNETAPENNGLWIVSLSGWSRPLAPTKFTVTVSNGRQKGTTWAAETPTTIRQVRNYSLTMWDDIVNTHPGLKLSVNTATEELLPPYVNASAPFAENALTNTIPTGAALPFTFGQGSPVETAWVRSHEYGYAKARALFRFDPLAFLGFSWGFNWVEVDGILYDGFDMSMPGHKRFKLHGDAIDLVQRSTMAVSGVGNVIITYSAYDNDRKQNFTVVQNGVVIGYVQAGVQSSIGGLTFKISDEGRPFRIGDRFEISNGVATFVPTATYKYLGFGQIFTNALRETSIDTKSSYAVSAFREWDVNMGYRAGGLVATDDLQVYTDAETLSESAFNLVFKRNQIARDEWLQALRITVSSFGRTIKKDFGVAPVGAGEDWVFKIEGYNPRYTTISYFNMSTLDNPMDFFALSKAHTDLSWLNPTKNDGIITTDLPLTIVGIQNVVSFLFGYSKYLEFKGWEFNKDNDVNIDAETGRKRNYQLEIEKFIDRCYAGIEAGQGHVINPFTDRVWLSQSTGLLSEFIDTSMFDITGHPGVFDMLGVKFKKDDLDVIRTNTQSSFGATAPIFSAHAQIDDFEHLFIFNNYSQPSTNSGLLYDPFSGARVATYKFNGRKQATKTMRPEFGGHFLVGDKVHQNMQASTDNIANLYDANHAFENETTTRHALALLGFNRKKYFDDLDISEKTQFNFWRGLIQAKGTNLSIDAYLNNNRFDDAKIDEYWAYKLADYGDARQRVFPELKLTVNDALTQFTKFQFDPKFDTPELNPLFGQGFTVVNSFENEERWFTLDDMNQDVNFAPDVVGTFILNHPEKNKTYTLPFVADALVQSADFTQVNATTIISNVDDRLVIVGYGPSRPHFNPVKLFNYVANELVAEIPVWHPAAGQHTPIALESINIISNLNPAKYNYSKQVVNNNTYDPLRPWGQNEVGRVWFDTRNLAYVPYYDKNVFDSLDERLSRWGTLADFATVDVYEWVKSTVPPSEYDALAAEQAGDAGLDPLTKAAGQVADKQSYSRERKWSLRPVAWSYSPVPVDVDWEDKPPFPAGATEQLLIADGLAILDHGTFADYKISAGMRLGAWNNDPANPKPLSEYIIEDKFSKIVVDKNGARVTSLPAAGGLPFEIQIDATGGADLAGEVVFSVDPGVSTSAFDGSIRVAPILLANVVGKDSVDSISAPTTQTENDGSGTPSGSGTQVIRFTPDLELGDLTKLSASKTYWAVVTIDGVATSISMTGNQVSTVEHLLQVLNDKFDSQPFDLESGNITVTSPTTGISSTVKLTGDLFESIQKFDATLPATRGFGPILGDVSNAVHGATMTVVEDDVNSVDLPELGIKVNVVAKADGVYPADVIANVIADTLNEAGLIVKDAVVITPVVYSADTDLSNDEQPNDYRYGWRVWSIPTQAELDEDGQLPFASWKPYVGDYTNPSEFSLAQIKEAVAYSKAPLTLRNGVSIARFKSTWTDWSLLKNDIFKATPISAGAITIDTKLVLDASRVSVYVNGIAQLKAAFTISGKQITLNFVPKGAEVTVIIRKYEPTVKELAFDPDVNDDLSFQKQYKQDYEYVSLPVRDREGALSSSVYFFWVKNKTTPALGKKQSVQAIAQELRDGPTNFLTFQNISAEAPYVYDAITISGLSYVVTKDDTFKLRFTRNFTLRDDPEQLDLKNIHTEWALMRPGQKTKVPEALWQKLTDSVAGVDAAGNAVPAIRRSLYDERNGTRTQFGFSPEQTLAPSNLLRSSIVDTIVNTKLVDDSASVVIPDYITFLDMDESDMWFSSPAKARQTMVDIWNQAKVAQVNEIFFAALNDILASNYELSDIFKTSRISAYSIKVITGAPVAPTFE